MALLILTILCACNSENKVKYNAVNKEADAILKEEKDGLEELVKNTFGKDAKAISPAVYINEGGGEPLDGSSYKVSTSDYIEFSLKINNREYESIYNYRDKIIYSEFYNEQICNSIKRRFENNNIIVDKVEIDVNVKNSLYSKKNLLSSCYIDNNAGLGILDKNYKSQFAVFIYTKSDIVSKKFNINKMIEKNICFKDLYTSIWIFHCDYNNSIQNGLINPMQVSNFPLVTHYEIAKTEDERNKVIEEYGDSAKGVSNIMVYNNFKEKNTFNNYLINIGGEK